MNKYLGGRLAMMAARLRLIANTVAGADREDGLVAVIESMEAATQLLRMYQYEWHQQMRVGMKAGFTPLEVGEASIGGLIRVV